MKDDKLPKRRSPESIEAAASDLVRQMLAKGDLPLSILKQAADEGNRLARQLADEKAHRENYLRDLVREALVTGLRRLDKVTEYVVEEAYLMRVPTREEVAEAILSLLKEIGQ